MRPNRWFNTILGGRCGWLLLALTAYVAGLAGAESAADEPDRENTLISPKVRVVLVGDSTVAEGSGWGPGFAARLAPGAECLNLARSGRSSKSFAAEGHWKKALEAKPDYLLIQFGHNDQPGKGPGRETDPGTTFRANLARYVDEARAIGARPILVTSLTRRHFSREGKIRSDLGPYVEAVRAVAEEKKVPLVDLHSLSIGLLDRIGPKASEEFDPRPRARAGPDGGGEPALADKTHLSPRGSAVFGKLVADELKKVEPALAPILR